MSAPVSENDSGPALSELAGFVTVKLISLNSPENVSGKASEPAEYVSDDCSTPVPEIESDVVPPGFEGTEIYAQFVVLDGLFGAPELITRSSNALKHTIGLD